MDSAKIAVSHRHNELELCAEPLECDFQYVPSLVSTSVGTIEPFAEWKKASIKVKTPDSKMAKQCDRDKYLRWKGLPINDPDPIHVKSNCSHNVYLSLHKRYLKQTPEAQPKKLDWNLLRRIVHYLVKCIKQNYQPFDPKEFLAKKSGRLRRRYWAAYNTMLKQGVDIYKMSDISAFVKLERYFEDGKAPRMIMGRNPAFTLLYSQMVEPIERAFFQLPQVANACDYLSCGEKFSKLVGEWFMENDMSKYEASQRFFTLQFEYLVYSMIYDGSPDLLDTLFTTKLHKTGRTTTGVNFNFEMCRGSGDADTSLGNGILNYISTMYFLATNTCDACLIENCKPSCHSQRFVLKGDDSYMAFPRHENYVNTYELFGFEAKLILRKTPEEVEFCSGHFVEYQPGQYIYVQKLRKLLQSLQTCINADAIRNGWVGQYYKSLGMMYNVIYAGLPVYEDIGPFLMSVDVKHGLRTELVGSYNLVTSFNNVTKRIGAVDRALAAVSVSMVNDMEFGELHHLQNFLKCSKIKISADQMKRMNPVKSKDDVGIVDFGLLNDQISTSSLTEYDKRLLQRLRQFKQKF
jgi:hypothetical protein